MVWLVLFTQIKIHTYIKMVKNIPTIERSTKIRFGKHATDDQAENTIVFNASNTAIDASTAGSMYMSPLREAELAGATFIGYSSSTKEVVDTGVATSLLGGVTLDSASEQGNVVSNSTPHFANVTTAFTTGHGANVGISNTNSSHMLSVGDKIFMSNTGAEAIKVEGNVRANRFFGGTSITIDQGATNKIQVSGKIKTSSIETSDHIAVSNNQTVTKLVSVGTHTFINTPSATENAISTSGNVSAAFYKGDGGLLSNIVQTSAIDAVKTDLASNSTRISTVSTDLASNSTRIGTVSTDLASNSTRISTVSTDLASNSTRIGVVETDLASNSTRIGTVSTDLASNSTRISTVSTDLASNASRIGVVETDLASNSTRIGTVSTDLTSNASRITTLESEVQPINRGGTGQTTAAAAASALGVGAEDQPSFVTVNANVIAHNVASTSLTDGIIPYTHSTKQLRDSKLSYNDATYVISVASNLVVTGNLLVQGSTTFQDSNIHSVSDPIIEVGNANTIDTIDMGIIMTRPTANVVAGFRGDEKEYTIAYTLSDPDGAHIVPTMATSDSYITANIWGNVLSGNVTSTGLIHGGTLKGDGSAITALNMDNASAGTLAVGRGGTGATTLNDLITLGTHTTGNYVTSITGGDGITAGAAAESGTPTVAIDAKADGGLVIESNKLAVDLAASSITGTLAVGDGGTGATSLNNLITMGTHTTGDFVGTITGGDGIASTGATSGEDIDHSLSIDAKSNGGLVIESNKLAVDLGASSITGTLAVGDGGTGATSAAAAASALGVGTEDSPSFVTVNANVVAGNVTSESIKLTDPAITGSFSTDTITINAENRTYGTAPLVVATGDIDKLNLDNLIDGAQVVVSILASGGDRAVSKDLTNVNFTVLTEDVTIDEDKHGLMTLSNIAGNVYMNTIAFS